jgi:sterol desaturase/sphingolipid hydroxylase (fatty acid hydroxylase superfamily)
MFWFEAIGSFVFGGLGWSLSEYVIHRWGAHEKRNRTPFQREHLMHHSKGNWFAATHKKVITALVVIPPIAAVGTLLFGAVPGFGFALGYASVYLGYELLHRRLHTHPPRGPVGRTLRMHHFWHHFGNARVNHGVTSRIWDRVFGTLVVPERVRVPKSLAPLWLMGDDGEVRPEFAADYVRAR